MSPFESTVDCASRFNQIPLALPHQYFFVMGVRSSQLRMLWGVYGVLQGAWSVDEHFRTAPLRSNLPVILGLLSVWNVSFLGHSARAILPYAQALSKLPSHIQQVSLLSPNQSLLPVLASVWANSLPKRCSWFRNYFLFENPSICMNFVCDEKIEWENFIFI